MTDLKEPDTRNTSSVQTTESTKTQNIVSWLDGVNEVNVRINVMTNNF